MKAQGYQTVTRSRAGKDGVSAFKSVVFKRSNEDIDAPVGGAYDSPVPSGWSDGVPGGEEKLWMSTRIFTNTGGAPQQAAWTTPSVVTDTADIDFEFSAAASNPGNPTSSPKLWHNTATSDDVWMAVRKKSNGVWGAWEVSKIKGEKGEDGKSYYTWIKYADNADGGGISDNPVAADGTLKKYIGFAYNKTSPTESNVASDYTWALFKGTDGTDGLPGKPGDDGTTYYTWIKYADALGSNGYPAEMYDTARTTTEYIGIAVNQTERAEGTDPTAYSWSKFKGEDGKGIVSQVDYYAVSASKTEVPTDWTPNTPPSMTATLRYLWKYTLTTFTDGSTEQTAPCVVGVFGVDGLSYRYSKWVAGVEYRNDNNPYYRDSNGQGIIDVVYVNGITMYDPNSDTPPPAGYICRKTHTSGDTVTFSSEGNWTQEDNVFTSDTITGNNATWAKIKFKTTAANTKITVKITASSEANYDWGYVCGLDADFSTTSYLAKVSGTNTQTVEIAVPKPGEHFFYVGYTKDVSGDKNNDNTVVEIISVSPSPIPLAVGEYWTQMNSMAPILTALVLADRIKANAIDVESLAANSAFINSLVANRVIAGVTDGQRIEILPENKSINIYNADGEIASIFEGNEYNSVDQLLGNLQGNFTILTRTVDNYYGYSTGVSMSKGSGQGSSNGYSRVIIPLTSPVNFSLGAICVIGGGTGFIRAQKPSGHGNIDLFINMEFRMATYGDSACTQLVSSNSLANNSVSADTYDEEYDKEISLANKSTFIATGYSRLELVITSQKTGQIGYGATMFSWTDLANISYNSDYYVSRYFANGLCLGIRNTNYVAIYNQAIGGMRMLMENEGYGFDFSQNGIKFRRNITEGWKSLIPKYGLPFSVLAVGTMNLTTSPSMGTYKTFDGNAISVSRQSSGTFRVAIPSSWGNSYIVQLTTLGRANSGNVVACSVYTISTGSFIVDTKTTGDTWVDEVKVMFLITRVDDFNI